ncbi:PREDICTED: endothelin-converting enzyme 1-like [Priapulus caudatus]|uniref:Endothelin-converting enzyme 1-like n=1 Tax=Priapulus caudatus TaxID=37621 RepID=A0ABM1E2F9_PRICU|nr:PREDICTED: endothelin-converting enzyme 1-like [Priapulus caudatus]
MMMNEEKYTEANGDVVRRASGEDAVIRDPMFGIPLQQMSATSKYRRTEFEDEDGDGEANGDTARTYEPGVTYRKYSAASLWRRRTAIEKAALVALAVCCVVIVILSCVVSKQKARAGRPPLEISIGYAGTHPLTTDRAPLTTEKPGHSQPAQFCLTPACVTVASSIINAMDWTINPCNDFFQFACGGWIKANPIPEGKSMWGTFGTLWQENQLVLKNVLEQPLPANASVSALKAQKYYKSCLDKNDTMELLGAQPLLDLIAKVGGWNITGEFDLETWNFQSTLQKLNDYVSAFFGVWVGEDDKNSTTHILQVDQASLGLDRKYYMNKTDSDHLVMDAYLDFMVGLGVLLGGEENSTRAQMEAVLALETEIANITTPADQRRDEEKMYHKMNISELTNLAPILNNYMVWNLARQMSPYLSKAFRELNKPLSKAMTGSDGFDVLWRLCVSDTDGVIGFALGAMFVQEVFDGDSKAKAERMVDSVKRAFKLNLPQLSWMDPETRQAAREKADAVIDMIGFPDYILDIKSLDNYYSGLEFDENQYFTNNVHALLWTKQRILQKLEKPVNKSDWAMTPPQVNAYYSPSSNRIVFPAGILQAPFYDQDYPKSLNFGAMGVVMGHELIHGFDDQGREYDKFGNLKAWWNNDSIVNFKERTQCLVDQSATYLVNGEPINGKQTLGENIADNGGLKSAYYAYQTWVKDNGEELPLPGVNYTLNQLFFLGFSQVWCSASTDEAKHLQLISDTHSPAKYRVIGPLSNSHEFASAWKCPVDTVMNPLQKCEVW